jgi:hypothetical protein
MPYVLIIVGAVILVTAINGTTGQLGTMLRADIFGSHGFIYWFLAILVIGAIGYIKPFKKLSDWLLVLVVLVLFLANKGGVFAQFNTALTTIGTSSQTATPTAVASTPSTANLSSTVYGSASNLLDTEPLTGLDTDTGLWLGGNGAIDTGTFD